MYTRSKSIDGKSSTGNSLNPTPKVMFVLLLNNVSFRTTCLILTVPGMEHVKHYYQHLIPMITVCQLFQPDLPSKFQMARIGNLLRRSTSIFERSSFFSTGHVTSDEESKEEQRALKTAFYNTAALVFVGVLFYTCTQVCTTALLSQEYFIMIKLSGNTFFRVTRSTFPFYFPNSPVRILHCLNLKLNQDFLKGFMK